MYCDQCEQTFRGVACTETGVCGKDADMESLQKILLYGLKGMASYKHHARRLGEVDEEIESFIEEALFATVTNVNFDMESLLELVLECGRMNLKTMQLLNDGHVEKLGQPAPVEVKEGIQEGPGILVTGHDMVDLQGPAQADRGHRHQGLHARRNAARPHVSRTEEAPAPRRPLRRRMAEAARRVRAFGGPILATTNCVLIPFETNTYLDRFFTTRVTAVPGATRLKTNDFSAVIAAAPRRSAT